MNPVRTFDQITQEILNKNDFETITVGILIADGNQAEEHLKVWNLQGMRLQVCRNGIRGKHPVIIWRVGNILIWNETAVSGVIYISPQF